jgi:hypothetical protein
MAIQDYGDLTINGNVVTYEGRVKIEAGSRTRVVNPQVDGSQIITTDISTNKSKITVPIRVTPETNKTFDALYDNGDNNIITFRDRNFTRCVMEVKPEREDLEIVEYVFMGNPEV